MVNICDACIQTAQDCVDDLKAKKKTPVSFVAGVCAYVPAEWKINKSSGKKFVPPPGEFSGCRCTPCPEREGTGECACCAERRDEERNPDPEPFV